MFAYVLCWAIESEVCSVKKVAPFTPNSSMTSALEATVKITVNSEFEWETDNIW